MRVNHSIPKSSSLALPSLIVVAIVVDLVRFSLSYLSDAYPVHILIFVFVVHLK